MSNEFLNKPLKNADRAAHNLVVMVLGIVIVLGLIADIVGAISHNRAMMVGGAIVFNLLNIMFFATSKLRIASILFGYRVMEKLVKRDKRNIRMEWMDTVDEYIDEINDPNKALPQQVADLLNFNIENSKASNAENIIYSNRSYYLHFKDEEDATIFILSQ